MEAPVATPAAPVLPQSVQLNEDAQLRVLSGRTTYVAEAKKKKEEEAVKEDQSSLKKSGDTFKTQRGGVATKTDTGISHKKAQYDDEDYVAPKVTKVSKASKTSAEKAGDRALDKKQAQDSKAAEKKNPGSVRRYQDGKLVTPGKKKEAVGESSEAQKAAREKFMNMVKGKKDKKEVKEGAKPDFLDIDKDGDKKEPMKKAVADKKKKVSEGSMKDMMYKDAQRMSREKFVEKYPSEGGYYDDLMKMDESAKPDFLDIDKDGDKKEPMKKAASEKKGMSAKQEKFFGKKKTVKESIETKMSFKQMVQLVQESGGQQQIDPIDKELFTWANRVASSKLGEGMKAELYAGLIYERNGGVFEMYDVLSEDQK